MCIYFRSPINSVQLHSLYSVHSSLGTRVTRVCTCTLHYTTHDHSLQYTLEDSQKYVTLWSSASFSSSLWVSVIIYYWGLWVSDSRRWRTDTPKDSHRLSVRLRKSPGQFIEPRESGVFCVSVFCDTLRVSPNLCKVSYQPLSLSLRIFLPSKACMPLSIA